MTRKKLVKQDCPHGVYVYSPLITQQDLIDCVIERVLGRMIVTWPEALESYLGRFVTAEDFVNKVQERVL